MIKIHLHIAMDEIMYIRQFCKNDEKLIYLIIFNAKDLPNLKLCLIKDSAMLCKMHIFGDPLGSTTERLVNTISYNKHPTSL